MKTTLETLLNKKVIAHDWDDKIPNEETLSGYYIPQPYCLQVVNPNTEIKAMEEVYGIFYSASSGWVLTFLDSDHQVSFKAGQEIEVTLYKLIVEL